MTTYQDVNWDTLRFIKKHLYRRLATPLNNALGRLAIARHVNDPAEAREQIRRVEQNLEIALNLVKAWAALIHVKSGGAIRQGQRRQITPDGFPVWLVDYLNTQTIFQIEHTRPILVHAETFYESLLLMGLIGAGVGTLKKLTTGDTPDEENTVWMRAIFDPPSSGPYTSLGVMFKRFGGASSSAQEIMFQLLVLQELLRINGATLRLQNNRRSGEQALSATFPAALGVEEMGADVFESIHEFSPRAGASSDETQETMLAHLMRDTDAARMLPASEKSANGPRRPVPEPVENKSETLIVPPPTFHQRLAARLDDALDEVENKSETLIVPPPNFREQLIARVQEAEAAESSAPDNFPQDSHSSETPDQTLTESPAELPGTGRFKHPPSPGVIEVVEPDNASETLIVPPPDYKRRLGLHRQTSSRLTPVNDDDAEAGVETGDQSAPAE